MRLQVTPVLDLTVTLEDLPIDGPENKVAERIKVYIVSAEEQADNAPITNLTAPSHQSREQMTQKSSSSQEVDAPLVNEPGAPVFHFNSPTVSVKETFPIGVPLPFDPPLRVTHQASIAFLFAL